MAAGEVRKAEAMVAMGKRLVRAKDKIRQAIVPFRVPEREELAARLDAVLDAISAVYTEGWTDAAGTDVECRDLTDESIHSWPGS
jgi:predicted RNA polymerase sigma factor